MLSSISILWVNAKRVFGKQDADSIIKKKLEDELLDARLHLMKAQTGMEYATSEVTYQSARVNRISAQLSDDFSGNPLHVVKTEISTEGSRVKGWHRVD